MMKNKYISMFSLVVILMTFSVDLYSQYEENEAYLVITGMKLNESPVNYVKDPSFGKNAIVKIIQKDGITIEKTALEFAVKKDGLTYYTADFKIPLDTEYSIQMTFNDGTYLSIPDYKLLSSWKTHFYFHSTDGTLSPACVLRSQGGITHDLRLCVFAVYPYDNYIRLGGKQLATGISNPVDNSKNMVVYPNPVTDQTVIKFDLNNPSEVIMTVTSLSGTQVFNRSLFCYDGEIQLPPVATNQLSKGIYMIELRTTDSRFIQKLIVH